MFKNIIIIFLVYLVASLMIQKPENVDLVVKDAATAKNMVVEGADYLHETFDREFSVHSEEEFEKEHGEKLEGSKNEIQEETWFNEKFHSGK